MRSPLISVCLLTHHNADYIADSIRSVQDQTFSDWEMLISDDASTDETATVVGPFLSDPRIRYVSHSKNLGQAANWAYAIENTSAPWIATLHADDIWRPETLARFVAAFTTQANIDLVWGNWSRVTPSLDRMANQPDPEASRILDGAETLRLIFNNNCVLPSASVVRRDRVQIAGLPDPTYGMLCDREWWLRIAKFSRASHPLSETLVDYRVHADSISGVFMRDGRLAKELDDLYAKLPGILENLPDSAALIYSYERKLAEWYFRMAIGMRVMGDPSADRRMQQALHYNVDLLRKPTFLIKWLLFGLRGVGRPILKRLHLQNHWVTAPAKTS